MCKLHHFVHDSFFIAVNRPVFSDTVFGTIIAFYNSIRQLLFLGGKAMRIKSISGAFLISLVFHILIVSLIGIFYQKQAKNLVACTVSVDFLISPETSTLKLRKPMVRSLTGSEVNRFTPTEVHFVPFTSNSVQVDSSTEFNSVSALNKQAPNLLKDSPIVDLSNSAPMQTEKQLSTANIQDKRVKEVRKTLNTVVENISLGNAEVPVLGLTPQSRGSNPVNNLPKGEQRERVIVRAITTAPPGVIVQNALNPPNGAVYDDVFYENHGSNPFIDTEDDKFSTFGMDVDTASYSVMRRYLRDGILPPPAAVRVEEFVNAFDYNYEPPNEDAFAVHIEGAPSKFGEGKRLKLMRIGIKGRVISDKNRKDAILTFVIDVSGSMARENRLGLVKRSLRILLDQLREGDMIGIVVYGTTARVLLPHTGIENREYILEAINRLSPDGSTNAEAGLREGYKLALKNSKSGCINRVILCSDGVANVGQTGPEAILKEVGLYVDEGITLTTVGFGMGNYNDVLMEHLANKGNGSYTYVDTIKEAKRVFVENLTGTLQVIAKDAKIQVEFNPETVSRFRLLGYENRSLAHEDFRKNDVDAGEVGAGHSVTALYEIKLHENAVGKLATVFIRHEDPDTLKVTEVNETFSTDQLKQTFEEATVEYQFLAAVAEYAEILKKSYWAKEGSLANVESTIERVLPHIDSKTPEEKQRKEELLKLVNKARMLKEQKDG